MARYKKGITLEEKLYKQYLSERKKMTRRGYGLRESLDKRLITLAVKHKQLKDIEDIKKLVRDDTIVTNKKVDDLAKKLIETNLFPPEFEIKYNRDGSVNLPSIKRQIRAMNGQQMSEFVVWSIYTAEIFEDGDDFEEFYY